MVSGIRMFAGSGSLSRGAPDWEGGSDNADPQFLGMEIFALQVGDTTSPTHVGFFGSLGAPSSPVIVGQYQTRTHRTNHAGADLGAMINVKYTGASDAEVSGVSFPNIEDIPRYSGTLCCRFREPSDNQVVTQNAILRAVAFNASSGVPDITDDPADIIIYAAQLRDTADTAGDSTWTAIADGTGSGSNSLALADQSMSAMIHDFHIILSASPQVAGTNVSWGVWVSLEYL